MRTVHPSAPQGGSFSSKTITPPVLPQDPPVLIEKLVKQLSKCSAGTQVTPRSPPSPECPPTENKNYFTKVEFLRLGWNQRHQSRRTKKVCFHQRRKRREEERERKSRRRERMHSLPFHLGQRP